MKNDTAAVQVQIAKSEHNGKKEIHCKFKVLYLEEACRKQNGIFNFEKKTLNDTRYIKMSYEGNNEVPFIELENVKILIK